MGDDIGLDGRDDDDVTVISDQDDDQRWKDAIALGDEMVMSLLRNLCKNQPAGKNPWSASHQKVSSVVYYYQRIVLNVANKSVQGTTVWNSFHTKMNI